MTQPRYPDQRTGFDSDTITAARSEDALTESLRILRNFRRANPDYTGPVRLTLKLDFSPDQQ